MLLPPPVMEGERIFQEFKGIAEYGQAHMTGYMIQPSRRCGRRLYGLTQRHYNSVSQVSVEMITFTARNISIHSFKG
jgi:hypothetical protein